MNILQEEILKLSGVFLMEATEFNTPEEVIRAIQRGQVPGVKATEFFKNNSETALNNSLKLVLNKIKASVPADEVNKYLFLFLKKMNNGSIIKVLNIIETSNNFNLILDPLKSYFRNVNKAEVKNDPEVKRRFTEFANSAFEFEDAYNFEKWANEKFAQKAKIKEQDEEKKLIYDKDGWQVYIAKTFAANRELACMNKRKATWCTAANNDSFNLYSENKTVNIYVIRNEEKDVMYQLDFGKRHGPNFKDEADKDISIKKINSINFPKDLLQVIKDENGRSLYEMLQSNKTEKDVNDENPTKQKNLGEWKETVFKNFKEFNEEIEKYNASFKLYDRAEKSARDIMKNNKDSYFKTINKIGKITNGEKTYYYVINHNGITYSINSTVYHESKLFEVAKINEGNYILSVVRTKEFLELDLPQRFKNKLLYRFGANFDTKKEKDFEKGFKDSDGKEIKPFYKENGVSVYAGFKNLYDVLNLPFLGRVSQEQLKKKILKKQKRNFEDKHKSNVSIKNIIFIIHEERENIYVYEKEAEGFFLYRLGTDESSVSFFDVSKQVRKAIIGASQKINLIDTSLLDNDIFERLSNIEPENLKPTATKILFTNKDGIDFRYNFFNFILVFKDGNTRVPVEIFSNKDKLYVNKFSSEEELVNFYKKAIQIIVLVGGYRFKKSELTALLNKRIEAYRAL
jgi:hypothetical protein